MVTELPSLNRTVISDHLHAMCETGNGVLSVDLSKHHSA